MTRILIVEDEAALAEPLAASDLEDPAVVARGTRGRGQMRVEVVGEIGRA